MRWRNGVDAYDVRDSFTNVQKVVVGNDNLSHTEFESLSASFIKTQERIETMKTVESRLLKYIPAKMRKYVVWLDFEKSSHTYFLTFEKNGKEISAEPSDSIEELRWNARQCIIELNNI